MNILSTEMLTQDMIQLLLKWVKFSDLGKSSEKKGGSLKSTRVFIKDCFNRKESK